MDKIKVLYIIDTLEGYGAEKSIVEITTNLQKIIPVFVHIYQGDMLKVKLEEAGIKVYSLDLTGKYEFNKAVEKLIPLIIKESPDLIHATLFRSEIIARKLKIKFPKIPLIGSFVSNAYSENRYKDKSLIQRLKLNYIYKLDRDTAKYVDFFISNSQTIKDKTGKKLGIELDKIKVIFRGRDSSNFHETSKLVNFPHLNNTQGAAQILNVSRLIPLKGQLDIIKALKLVVEVNPEVQLLFAGHGPSRGILEYEVKKLNLQDKVEFLGRVDHVNSLLDSADVFVYSSYSEGLPGALIEAMMAGKIIIASNIPENLECVDHESAIIFEKGNIRDLADKIIQVLQYPSLYKIKGVRAREVAIEKFETKKIVLQYENAYTNFLKLHSHSPLKILHLIQKPQNRGAEIFCCQLASHQQKSGHIVKIVSIYPGNADLPWEGEIESLDASSNLRFLDFAAWRKLDHIIKDFRPNIIQANAGDTLKYAVFSKKIFSWRTPIIFRNASEVGRYLKSDFQKILNSFLYKNIDGVASVSKASQKDILIHFPFLKGKTHLVPVGLEKEQEKAAFLFPVKARKNIVHVGGFSFEKNHEGLIRIFNIVRTFNKDVMLHLVGDGPLKTKVETLVEENNLSQHVKFYGFVNNPLDFISAADVLVLPSIIEGLPGVILEAMYCKTPVVAYAVGGIGEIVNSETGIIVEKDNEQFFADAVIKTLIQPDLQKIDNAYKLVCSRYMNKNIAKEFKKIYIKLQNSTF